MRKSLGLIALTIVVFTGACGGEIGGSQGPIAVTTPNAAVQSRAGKADVCHREGRGFRLVNVSAAALPSHMNHADGVPGELVPGNRSKRFDRACGQVEATVCPCRFTAEAVHDLEREFGDLGRDYDFFTSAIVTQLFSRRDVGDRQANRFFAFQAPGPEWPQASMCVARVYEPGFTILRNDEIPVTPDEARVCVEDLSALARLLGAAR